MNTTNPFRSLVALIAMSAMLQPPATSYAAASSASPAETVAKYEAPSNGNYFTSIPANALAVKALIDAGAPAVSPRAIHVYYSPDGGTTMVSPAGNGMAPMGAEPMPVLMYCGTTAPYTLCPPPGGGGGGATIPTTQSILKGDNTGNAAATLVTVDTATKSFLYAPSMTARIANGTANAWQRSTGPTDAGISSTIAAQPTFAWTASTAVTVGTIYNDGQHLEKVTTAGTTGTTEPLWSAKVQVNGTYTFLNSTYTDGTAVWTNQGVGVPDILAESSINSGIDGYDVPNDGSSGHSRPMAVLPKGTHLIDNRNGSHQFQQYDTAHSTLSFRPGENSTNWVDDGKGVIFGTPRVARGTSTAGGLGTDQIASALNTTVLGDGMNGGGGNWTSAKNAQFVMYGQRLGINQNLNLFTLCFFTADCAGLYSYMAVNPGTISYNDEGVAGANFQISMAPDQWAVTDAPTTTGDTTINAIFQDDDGAAAPGNTLVDPSAAVAYYLTSNAGYRSQDAWSMTIPAGSVAGSTAPPKSTGHFIITSCYPQDAGSLPYPRTCTGSMDTTVGTTTMVPTLTAAQDATNGVSTLACYSGTFTEPITITSATSTTVNVIAAREMGHATGEEIWQGGPCGMALAFLDGASASDVLATHNIVTYPVVGSSSVGTVAINATSLGGQNGRTSPFTKKDYTINGVYAGRISNNVSFTAARPSLATWINSQTAIAITSSDTSFNTTLSPGSVTFTGNANPTSYTSPFVLDPTNGDNASYTQPGSNANAYAVINIAVSNLDGYLLMPSALIHDTPGQLSDGANVLNLSPNRIGSLAQNHALTQAHYLDQNVVGLNVATLDNGYHTKNFNSVRIVADGVQGSAIQVAGGGDPRSPTGAVLMATGLFRRGIKLSAPTFGQSVDATVGAAIEIDCPGAPFYTCGNAPVNTYNYLSSNTAQGAYIFKANGSTGALYATNPGGATFYGYGLAGQPNPMNPPVAQTLATNAWIWGDANAAPTYQITQRGYLLNTGIGGCGYFNFDPNQDLVTSPSQTGNTTCTARVGLKTARIGSSTASNSDFNGEFPSGVTTQTYTWAYTDYAVHPEVTLTCQFNCNGNSPWVTYTGTTSFTINFAVASTGPVTYSVGGRSTN